jgi:Flp pilus assembly protein TadG
MCKKRLSRLWAATEGLGAVELGFIAPFLLLLLLGIADFGLAFWQQMEIANAADAGSQYAMANSFDQNTVTNIARNATNLTSVQLDQPAPAQICGCATSTGVTSGYGIYPNCTSCPDGTAAKGYVVVNTRICYTTLFTWPGLNYCSTSTSSCSGCSANQIALTAQSIILK